MMRILFLPFVLVVAGCATTVERPGEPRSDVLRDVESYAVACCLARQTEPYLKDQASAWASGIVQRSHGDIEHFKGVCKEVEREDAKGDTFVVLMDGKVGRAVKAVPLAHCFEILDTTTVRASIQKAVDSLVPDYEAARDLTGNDSGQKWQKWGQTTIKY